MSKQLRRSSRQQQKTELNADTEEPEPVDVRHQQLLEELDLQNKTKTDVENALHALNMLVDKNEAYLRSIGLDLSDMADSSPLLRDHQAETTLLEDQIQALYDESTYPENVTNDWIQAFRRSTLQICAATQELIHRKGTRGGDPSFNYVKHKREIKSTVELLVSFVMTFNVSQIWFIHIQGLLDDLQDLEFDLSETATMKSPSKVTKAANSDMRSQDHNTPYVTPPASTIASSPVKETVHKREVAVSLNSAILQRQMDKTRSNMIKTWKRQILPTIAGYRYARRATQRYEAKVEFARVKEAPQKQGKRKKGENPEDRPFEVVIYETDDLEEFDNHPFLDVALTLPDKSEKRKRDY
ncbi:hypothetical protein DRE_06456 [Drechslerella stenobrocha 248]|uniref:Uncharacterized protein n=1 Tax=Drechslerella stenobrocha 248 TaxID=1043628 RepID=W7HY07_9PEZI|nr:hypothetical protein DRE_06456 [Drechslerella stenobrocha 248]